MSPCSRAGYSSSYRESYSRFPPQLQSWRIRKSALWNFHCIYVLPGRRLFIAFSFWHNSNDSPRISPASIFGLKGSFLQLYFILAYFWSCNWDSGLKGSFLQLYFILAYFWWHIIDFTVWLKSFFFFFYCMVKMKNHYIIHIFRTLLTFMLTIEAGTSLNVIHIIHTLLSFNVDFLRQAPLYITRHVSIVAGQTA